MNKSEAKKRALEGGISVGELRAMISSGRDSGGMSVVNPQFTKDQVLDMFEAALEGRSDDQIPDTLSYNVSKNRTGPSKYALIIQNILRECA